MSVLSRGHTSRLALAAHGFLRGGRCHRRLVAVLDIEGRSAGEVFGSPDDLKLKSCATLFASVSPAGSSFERLLDKYSQGQRDEKTLRLMEG